jgi:hypothetical protein
MSNISIDEIELIKKKTSTYLTKSIYKLCYILGKNPEDVMTASSLENLISDEVSQMQKDALTSLFNQVNALKKLN